MEQIDPGTNADLIARATWHPCEARKREANWTAFLAFAGLDDYRALEARTAADPDWFWRRLIDFLDVRFETPFSAVRDVSAGPAHVRWCVGGRLNMTVTLLDRHLAAGRGDHPALLFETEDGAGRSLTYTELARQVEALAAGLVRVGVGPGDVVGLFLPMIPEAVIAFLAIARLGGASCCRCSPASARRR